MNAALNVHSRTYWVMRMLKSTTAIKISEPDNVAIAIAPIVSGSIVFGVPVLENIPAGHKVALADIKDHENIIKYGAPIGHARMHINAGQHVHTHNLKTNLGSIDDYYYTPEHHKPVDVLQERMFMGYNRAGGKAGIRNEIWIINTVGCVNKIAERIVAATKDDPIIKNKTDGIFTFVHPYGCSQLGEDNRFTQDILANMVHHPNASGVLVLGLGCENNNIDEFKKVLGETDANRVKFLNAQDVEDEVAEGIKLVKELSLYAAGLWREPIPLSKLTIGLKCGGSDGFSGITANPLVGNVSDLLIAHGGSALLTEVPEMFGAETLLMNRCKDVVVFNKTVALINNFKQYFMDHGQEIYENPSPGNKEGGISTLEDKSLGCTQKGGHSPVVDVLDYGDVINTSGLNLLQGPGNDIVAVTNLMAAGAQIVLFTTGRGTPLGGPIPTIKISSNSTLAAQKPHWIDFDAGVLLSDTSMKELTAQFFDYIVDVASGVIKTKNEVNDYREISIFKDGVTL